MGPPRAQVVDAPDGRPKTFRDLSHGFAASQPEQRFLGTPIIEQSTGVGSVSRHCAIDLLTPPRTHQAP
jgi:hypothetical protein